jgi:hypothetical protein
MGTGQDALRRWHLSRDLTKLRRYPWCNLVGVPRQREQQVLRPLGLRMLISKF